MKLGLGHNRGFTLAELLIAMAISVAIVAMLGAMFGSLANTASRANQRTDSFRDARAALQMIERDLNGLLHVPSSAYLLLTDQTYGSDPGSPKGHQIFALCSIKNKPFGSAAPGDVCAVGYYSSWDTNHYTLRRYFRDSAATFGVFTSIGAGNYVSPIVLYKPGQMTTTAPIVNVDEVLADYAWNIQTTAYKPDGTIDSTFPMEVGSPGVTKPAAIEISFTAMSSSAARVVMSIPSIAASDWTDPSSQHYKQLIAPHAYQFRTRINLP
jgi:prepilin-type N-terminal cleavage/methylation domain-containing protein